jgi:hypothetical protein
MDTHYICLECGFHGTADEFDRHELSAGYDHGTDNYAIAEVELQCPECGAYEDEEIVEASFCDFCGTWQPEESVHKLPDENEMICAKCSVARKIIKGDTK